MDIFQFEDCSHDVWHGLINSSEKESGKRHRGMNTYRFEERRIGYAESHVIEPIASSFCYATYPNSGRPVMPYSVRA